MIDYLQKFRLDSKTAYIVGGLGLIGREVSIALASSGAKTIVLDLDSEKGPSFEKEMHHKGFDVIFRTFDCANLEQISLCDTVSVFSDSITGPLVDSVSCS